MQLLSLLTSCDQKVYPGRPPRKVLEGVRTGKLRPTIDESFTPSAIAWLVEDCWAHVRSPTRPRQGPDHSTPHTSGMLQNRSPPHFPFPFVLIGHAASLTPYIHVFMFTLLQRCMRFESLQ